MFSSRGRFSETLPLSVMGPLSTEGPVCLWMMSWVGRSAHASNPSRVKAERCSEARNEDHGAVDPAQAVTSWRVPPSARGPSLGTAARRRPALSGCTSLLAMARPRDDRWGRTPWCVAAAHSFRDVRRTRRRQGNQGSRPRTSVDRGAGAQQSTRSGRLLEGGAGGGPGLLAQLAQRVIAAADELAGDRKGRPLAAEVIGEAYVVVVIGRAGAGRGLGCLKQRPAQHR